MSIARAREFAFDILMLVEERGGYASELLYRRGRELESRDAGLASEIVFGVLRYRAQLDWVIDGFLQKPGSSARRLDAAVRTALRMGVYQLRYLDRVPAHAAVGESVELVKQHGARSAAGLVNAVLRKVRPGQAPVEWPDRATALSMPEWLLERWEQQYSKETAETIARTFLEAPETYVRVPPRHTAESVPENWAATELPGCYRVPAGTGAQAVVEGYRCTDIGAQSIVPLLDLHPGQTFLDVCAAPGHKTAQALESGVKCVACDLHWSRVATLRGLVGCHLVVADATRPLPLRRPFEGILVDAPCSGTGTLGRNPEIRWRLTPEDVEQLHNRQVAILQQALAMLAPGGRLVYSTCSLEREENEGVIERVLGPERMAEVPVYHRIPGIDPGDGFFAAVITSR
jgi:16S rRNA (cytosine967-C5)-methyltransferase